MMPKSQGRDIEFFVVQPVYKSKMVLKKNEFGIKTKQEVNTFVKEIYARVWMDKSDIGPYGQYVGSKGEILKNRTLLFNRVTDSYYKVAHSIEEVREVLNYEHGKIGYKKIS